MASEHSELHIRCAACCAGQLLAPNLKIISLTLSSSLHWSRLNECPHLEQVTIHLLVSDHEDNPDDSQLCTLSFCGCSPDCLHTIAELHLEVSSLKEDGQFQGLGNHRLMGMSMVIREPHLAVFDISELTRCQWTSSEVKFVAGFSCSFRR